MSAVWTVILMRWENSISSECGLRRKIRYASRKGARGFVVNLQIEAP